MSEPFAWRGLAGWRGDDIFGVFLSRSAKRRATAPPRPFLAEEERLWRRPL